MLKTNEEAETQRLEKLYLYGILNPDPDARIDQITKALAGICGTSMALVGLVDKDRVVFKSRFGLTHTEASRDGSFCHHVIQSEDFFEVPDTHHDDRFTNHYFVTQAPYVRFYAAVPLMTADSLRLGTLCVLDSNPKKLTEEQKLVLKTFADNIVELFESGAKDKRLHRKREAISNEKDLRQKLSESNEYLDLALEGSNLGIWDWNLTDNTVKYSERWAKLRGEELSDLKMDLSDWESRVHPEDLPGAFQAINDYLQGKTPYFEKVHRVKHKNGSWVHILGRARFSAWDENGKPTRFTGTDMDISELMSSKLKLDRFFRLAPYGFAFCDMDGKFIELNEEFSRITGYTKDELSQLHIWDLTPEKYREVENLQLRNLEETGAYGPFRKEYIRKNGELIHVELNGFKVEDYDGRKGIWSIIQDITEKVEAETSMRKMTSELNSFFELSPSYVCIMSPEGKFTKLNPTWTNLGYSLQELLSTNITDLVHPDDLPSTFEQVAKLSRRDKVTGFCNRYRKKDGSYIFLEWFSATETETGLVFGAAIDITERKRREEMNRLLSYLREKFIHFSNDKVKFFEFLLKEVLSLTKSEYGFIGEILEDQKGKFLKTFALTDISWDQETKKFYESNAPYGLEFRNLNTLFGEVIKTGELLLTNDAPSHPKAHGTPTGHPALNSFMGIPVTYGGEVFAMIGVANSTTGYSLEDYEFLRPIFELIGEMVHSIKLNAELDIQKRLTFHSSKLASIGELAAGVGHEINNPLAIIWGQLEMLRYDLEELHIQSPEIEQKIIRASKAIDRIANITKGLRTFARSDQNEISSFNLSELMKETIGLVYEIYLKEGISISSDIEDFLWLNGNRGRIQQVFINILSNARDALMFSVKKEIKVVARSFRDSEIKITFTDSGPGVPEQLRHKIFDPFFTTKEVNKGTGIGLALASSIIDEHRGVIALDQERKTGASFVITLPRLVSPGIAEAKVPVLQDSVGKELCGRILVVDDEPDLREVLEIIFKNQGVEVVSATNGKEALEYIKKHSDEIDLIISDIKMPVMSGSELARAVKKLGTYHGGVVLITGGVNVSPDDYMDISDGLLTKPFSVDLIMNVVTKWIAAK